MKDMVSWKDYDGIEGFGAQGDVGASVQELNKALAAGNSINPPGSQVAGDGFAMRVESLERTLRTTTFKMEHIKLWKALSKIPAYNTVEEYNRLLDYGSTRNNKFIAEGDLPESDDSTYERDFAIVKYMGTTRSVTHVMSLVKPAHGNIIAQETVNGTMDLLRSVEEALFGGDSDLSSVQFDGYSKQIKQYAPGNVIDMRGAPLSEDALMDACLIANDAPNYGTPTHLYTNPRVKADLVKSFFSKARYDALSKTDTGMIGLDVKGFTSTIGDIMMETDTFITDGGSAPVAATGNSAKRPLSPTISTAATTPATAGSKFVTDDAGDYFMKVVACNRYGKSAAVNVDAAAITVAAGDAVSFGVTPGGGSPAVEWYEVYRSLKGGLATQCRQVLRVKNSNGTGAQTIVELNAKIPGTTEAFLFQQNSENMAIKQLAPMIKVPLAQIDTSIRWMQLLYIVPVLYTPLKNVMFTNVGRAPGSLVGG